MKTIYKLAVLFYLLLLSTSNIAQSGNTFILHKPFNNFYFYTIKVDNNGVIWAGARYLDSLYNGLYKYENGVWTRFQFDNNIQDFAIAPNNNIWIGDLKYVDVLEGTTFTKHQLPTNLSLPNYDLLNFFNVTVDISNNVWLTQHGANQYNKNESLFKFDGSNWTIYNYTNSNFNIYDAKSLVSDSKGNIWFSNVDSTNLRVLVKFDGQNFETITTQPAESPAFLWHTIYVDKNDHIWFLNKFKNLVEYDGQQFNYFAPQNNSNFQTGDVWSVAIDGYGNKWIAADYGIYRIIGNTWTEWKYSDFGLQTQYPSTLGMDITVDRNNNIWVATNSGIIEFNPNGIVTDVEDENVVNIPKEFSLSQNYPNPFNPETAISYTIGTGKLSALSFVSLKVFDVLGREVATLVNEEKPAGTYTINFNAEGLSSGIYFYKMQAGSFVQIKKLVLMK